jgi:hypothetical protein
MGQRLSARVLVVGLDRSGKSLLVRRLRGPKPAGETETVLPTAGLERMCFSKKRVDWTFLEVSAPTTPQAKAFWSPWLSAVDAVVFVVDASDTLRLAELSQLFSAVVADSSRRRLPLLVLCNEGRSRGTLDGVTSRALVEVDSGTASALLPAESSRVTVDVIRHMLEIDTIAATRRAHITQVDALRGDGCELVLDWLQSAVAPV